MVELGGTVPELLFEKKGTNYWHNSNYLSRINRMSYHLIKLVSRFRYTHSKAVRVILFFILQVRPRLRPRHQSLNKCKMFPTTTWG